LIAVIMLGSTGLIIDFSLRAIKETYKIKLKYPTLSVKGFYEFSSAAAADMLALISPLLIMAYAGGILAIIFSYHINIYALSRFMELPNLKFQLYRIFMGGAGFIISVKLGVWAAVKMLKTPPLDKERKKHII
ncbi:MAG: YibE/F family protein, partial [Elusimicrobiota bacterium]